ncbi:MAG: ArdC family protein, partial [Atopobiaceae bacterium]
MRGEKGKDTLAEGRARLVESLARAMEEEGLSWYAGWERCWSARNAATGARYRGINRLSLAAASARCGFDDPRWITYNQAREAGWHVRRGERAQATVEFWSWYVRIVRAGRQSVVTVQRALELVSTGKITEGDVCGEKFLRGRGAWVFNASQVEGVPPLPVPHASDPRSQPWRV